MMSTDRIQLTTEGDALLNALRVALEDLDATEPLGKTTEAVIDAAQRWYLASKAPTKGGDKGTLLTEAFAMVCKLEMGTASQQDAAVLMARLSNELRSATQAPMPAPELAQVLAENERLHCQNAVLLDLKQKADAEAKTWFDVAQHLRAEAPTSTQEMAMTRPLAERMADSREHFAKCQRNAALDYPPSSDDRPFAGPFTGSVGFHDSVFVAVDDAHGTRVAEIYDLVSAAELVQRLNNAWDAVQAPTIASTIPVGWSIKRDDKTGPGCIRVTSPLAGPGGMTLVPPYESQPYRMLFALCNALLGGEVDVPADKQERQ